VTLKGQKPQDWKFTKIGRGWQKLHLGCVSWRDEHVVVGPRLVTTVGRAASETAGVPKRLAKRLVGPRDPQRAKAARLEVYKEWKRVAKATPSLLCRLARHAGSGHGLSGCGESPHCSDCQAPSKGSMDSSSEESSEGPSAESSPASSDEL
jgi:hypothetical protein